MTDVLLEVRSLKKYFPVTRGFLKRVVGWRWAVDGVSLSVAPGEIVGLVGESGCGISTLGKTILGLSQPTAGEVRFEGRTVSGLPADAARRVRRDIQYVYQDPGASLDPWWTVGRSIREPLVVHTTLSRPETRNRIEEIIAAVGLELHHLQRYPHEFKGEPPHPDDMPSGCRFRLRCPLAQPDPCAHLEPTLQEISAGHTVACHLADKSSETVLAR